MDTAILQSTIESIAMSHKGILAADESTPTIGKRFQTINVENTEDNRRAYRELLFTTDGLEQFISGVILYEETLNQATANGVSFPELLAKKGIVPGIKVDKGVVELANTSGEKVTQGLDGLPERLAEYKAKGAKFAKWRAIYQISDNTPSTLLIKTNAHNLARYAAICQNLGIVPIVEPEVLIDGDHSLATCQKVTEAVQYAVFKALVKHKVLLEYMILKPSMVLPGNKSSEKASSEQIAEATIKTFRRTVPAAVPTINFLSGGLSPEQATENLEAMNAMGAHPWNLSFSYGRALQENSLKAWQGQVGNIAAAQNALMERSKANGEASSIRIL